MGNRYCRPWFTWDSGLQPPKADAPPIRLPTFIEQHISSAPLLAASCARTRSGGRTILQQRQVALAPATVPANAPPGRLVVQRARNQLVAACHSSGRLYTAAHTLRLAFLQSQKERSSGISAPQLGASQRTSPGPKVSNRLCTIRIDRIKLSQFLLRRLLDLASHAAELCRQLGAVTGNIFKQNSSGSNTRPG